MPRITSTKEFLELPITVQHCWDSYALVDDALVMLERGQFLHAALLADAVYTDDRVLGVLSTRVNALFALPMTFKYQGQDDSEEAAPSSAPLDGKDETKKTFANPDPAKAAPAAPPKDAAPDDLATALKKQVRDSVKKNWNRMFPQAALKELVRWGILLNVGMGELVWGWTEEGDYLPTLKTWNTQFAYWRWDTRAYYLITQNDPMVKLTPGDGRWVLFSPMGHNHGWLYGLIRALGKLWLDRVYAFRDWARASEKWSLGVMKGIEPANALESEKAKFEHGLRNMAAESIVICPTDAEGKSKFDVEMVETDPATGGGEAFDKRIQRLDTCIAVAVLGQNLSTEISGSSGSRAAAQVHENVRGDFLKADVDILQTMVSTQVLAPYVEYNYADLAEEAGLDWHELIPQVTWEVDPPEDLNKDADSIGKVATAIPNLMAAQADVRKLLARFKIPVLEEQDNSGEVPPGDDVNERPGAQDDEEGEDVEASRVPAALKRGSKRGQVYADDLIDAAKGEAARLLSQKREALLNICRTSATYEEIRRRVRELYAGSKQSELREVVTKSLMIAQLVGRLGAREDHQEHG